MFTEYISGSVGNRRRVVSSIRLLVGACLMLALTLQPSSGQSGKSPAPDTGQDVTLKARLVSMEVTVKDKKGKFITDLGPEDFTITENGVAQKVEFFEAPLVGDQKLIPGKTRSKVTVQGDSEPTRSSKTSIISLVLDEASTEQGNLREVREGTVKYIRERIGPADSVAVFAIANDLQLLQTFTPDKEKLVAAVERAYTNVVTSKTTELASIQAEIEQKREQANGIDADGATLAQSPSAGGAGSATAQAMMAARVMQQFIELRSALSVQQARPVLAALAAICKAQASIPGKKTVVLFSQGFVTPAVLDWQVQSVIDAANRANVAIYIIDSAGLRASAPLVGGVRPDAPLMGVSGSLSTDSRMRTKGGENVFDHVRFEGLDRNFDILYRLSGDTGGEFIKGTNDITRGLDRIDQQVRARYTLAYYTTDTNFDGSFRKVKIDVRRADAEVGSRPGYYANATEEGVPLSPDDKKLLTNLAAAESNPALPLFSELSPFRLSAGQYVVPFSIEVRPSAEDVDKKTDKQHIQFDLLGVIREGQDKVVSRVGGVIDMAVSPEQYKAISTNNLFYRQDLQLAPGEYTIDLILRDKLTGKMAAKREKLVLPALDTEFSTSGIVLSRMAVPTGNASAAANSSDVLSQGGIQIRPSPQREFHPNDKLIIFYEVYNAAISKDTAKPMVRTTVTIMQGDRMVVRPIDYVLTEPVAKPETHLVFAKYIKLGELPAGKYTAQIETMDTVTHKVVKHQAEFSIVK